MEWFGHRRVNHSDVGDVGLIPSSPPLPACSLLFILVWFLPELQAFISVRFVAGVIHRERIPAFERMLWRACRGNVFLKQAEIDTPLEDPVTVSAPLNGLSCVTNYLLFLSGWSSDEICFHHLLPRRSAEDTCEENLRRVSGRTNCCRHSHMYYFPTRFRATLYPCPETAPERREMAIGVMTRIEDLNTVSSHLLYHCIFSNGNPLCLILVRFLDKPKITDTVF
jgi:hypothetical protein